MVNVQVRDVPEDVHKALQRQAKQANQSLQQYLSEQLRVLATTPTMADFMDRIAHQNLGRITGAQAAADIRAERDERAGR